MAAEPRPIASAAVLRALAGDDGLVVWTAQGFRDGVRAWGLGDAVVVGCPDLSRRDRLAVRGSPEPAVELARHALAHMGRSFRLVGDAGLLRSILAAMPELELVHDFGWMEAATPPPPGFDAAAEAAGLSIGWLGADRHGDVERLLDEAFPDTHARPSRPGARRWAGAVDPAGRLVSVAADVWSTAEMGFLAGVGTVPAFRRRGAAAAVCGFVLGALVAEHGRAALMVDAENAPAIRVYERLGMSFRLVAGARLRPQ